MKLVFTTHTYYPNKDGVQYVTEYIAEGMANDGNEVIVIVPQKKYKSSIIENHNNVKIIRPYFRQRHSFVIGKNEICRKLVLEECSNADVLVNCAIQSPINNFVLKLFKKIKCKKILYLHGLYDYKINKNIRFIYKIKKVLLNIRWFIFYKINASKYRKYDYMINISSDEINKNFFNKLNVNVPVEIINNAVEDFSKVTTDINFIKKYDFITKKYFLNVANFNERKNQLMLINAFEAAYKLGLKDVFLVLIGASSKYSELCIHTLEKMECKNNVKIFVDFPRENTKIFIKHCYCGIMSSTFEVYPIFLSEVLMCGKPFISTNVGCACEMNGGLIAKDEKELTEKIIYIIDNKEKYEKLSNIGYKYAKDNFNQAEKVKQFENVINKIS